MQFMRLLCSIYARAYNNFVCPPSSRHIRRVRGRRRRLHAARVLQYLIIIKRTHSHTHTNIHTFTNHSRSMVMMAVVCVFVCSRICAPNKPTSPRGPPTFHPLHRNPTHTRDPHFYLVHFKAVSSLTSLLCRRWRRWRRWRRRRHRRAVVVHPPTRRSACAFSFNSTSLCRHITNTEIYMVCTSMQACARTQNTWGW